MLRCDDWYDDFEEKCREVEELDSEVERLRVELEAMTSLRDSWKNSAEEIAAQRDGWKSGCEGWTRVANEARNTLYHVRRYAESRCNEEYQDYASASVVLHLLDGELGVVGE